MTATEGALVRLDLWQAIGLMQRLRIRGVRCEEFTFSASSVGRLAATLHLLLGNRQLALPNDDLHFCERMGRSLDPGAAPSRSVVRSPRQRGGHSQRGEREEMKRFVLVAACLVFAVAVVAPTAGADPTNAKNSALIQANCGGQIITVSVNGNGTFTPAHDINSTSVFVPTAFDLIFTFTPTSGPQEVDHSTAAKPGANATKDTVTCQIPEQTLFSGPEGTATIQGTVMGFWTPQ